MLRRRRRSKRSPFQVPAICTVAMQSGVRQRAADAAGFMFWVRTFGGVDLAESSQYSTLRL